MAQISNSNSLVAVKVLPKKEFSLTDEVRIRQTLTLFEEVILHPLNVDMVKLDGRPRDQH